MRPYLATTFVGLSVLGVGTAQEPRPFSLDVVAFESGREVQLVPRSSDLRALAARDRVRLADLLLPDGRMVDLELERISTDRRRFGFVVDGEARPALLEDLDLTVWTGRVVQDAESSALLAFSRAGSNGWIRCAGQLVHFTTRADTAGSWADATIVLTSEHSLATRGMRPGFSSVSPPVLHPDAPPASPPTNTACQHECTIAVETDDQLYAALGSDVDALAAYVATLLTFVSYTFEEQADTVLTFPYVQFHTDGKDPWVSQDAGGSALDLLVEFQSAWGGELPEDARLGHFLSGAQLGGGAAYADVLCNDFDNFAVSGDIDGLTRFPIEQGPSNWDFYLVAHDLGRNFGALRTHEFCPEPLDECAPPSHAGPCQQSHTCGTGTIMSFCHLCEGGTANIETHFHPLNAERLVAAAEACLPGYIGIDAHVPTFLAPETSTPVVIGVRGAPDGPVRAFYRDDGGAFAVLPMEKVGGGLYSVDLPPAACGSQPEVYFTFTDAVCGDTVTSPAGAPEELFQAFAGYPSLAAADTFEQEESSWQAYSDAGSGGWEHGAPVAGGAGPLAADGGAGKCWVTGNASKDHEVKGGPHHLISPAYAAPYSGDFHVRYSWFLNLKNSNDQDWLVLEVNGGAGWQEIARHTESQGKAWGVESLTAFVSAGDMPTGKLRFRFTVMDGGAESTVEAAIDTFRFHHLGCATVGESFCGPANLNSTDESAELRAIGSPVAADGSLTLVASQLPPHEFGYFLNSRETGFVPFVAGSEGNLCLAGEIGRYSSHLQASGADGWMSLGLDLQDTPRPWGSTAILAGETWHFQCWFRDRNPDDTSNMTDGVSVRFL